MVVRGVHYDDKTAAGEALIRTCKEMKNPDPIELGQYRGFAMELAYSSFSKEYMLTLVGALRHSCSLGTDVFGNITRIDNVLDGFQKHKQACEQQLETARGQLAEANVQVDASFPQVEELQQKTARLRELNTSLNIDEKESILLDDGQDAEESAPPEKTGGAR